MRPGLSPPDKPGSHRGTDSAACEPPTAPILRDLKRLQRRERKPLGRLVSELLAPALERRLTGETPSAPFAWVSRDMTARVDLADKDTVLAILDRS
jgi:hypothetical protein